MKSISFAILCSFLCSKSYSCSCSLRTQHEEIQQSDLIIRAKVISIDTITVVDSLLIDKYKTTEDRLAHARRQLLIKVIVQNKYKGSLNDRITNIITGLGGGDCGYPFSINQDYLIYSGKSHFKKVVRQAFNKQVSFSFSDLLCYETSSCMRTTSDIEDEYQILRKELANDSNTSF